MYLALLHFRGIEICTSYSRKKSVSKAWNSEPVGLYFTLITGIYVIRLRQPSASIGAIFKIKCMHNCRHNWRGFSRFKYSGRWHNSQACSLFDWSPKICGNNSKKKHKLYFVPVKYFTSKVFRMALQFFVQKLMSFRTRYHFKIVIISVAYRCYIFC